MSEHRAVSLKSGPPQRTWRRMAGKALLGAAACMALAPVWAQSSYWVDGNGRVFDQSGNEVREQSAAQHAADLQTAAQQPKKRVWINSNDRKAAGFHAQAAQALAEQGKAPQGKAPQGKQGDGK